MSNPINEAEIRAMVERLKTTDPKMTNENVIKRIRSQLELTGVEWSNDLERKISYCVRINPN
jgi:hypothetical protein